jgi:hypothetical protein
MTVYKQLRDELADLQARFEAKAFSLVPLYHDLIWSPELRGWGEEEFASLRQANAGHGRFSWEEWELWPGALACSRFYGNGATPASRLIDFRHLAARAYRVLCAFHDLQRQGQALPTGYRLTADCISDVRPQEPGSASC